MFVYGLVLVIDLSCNEKDVIYQDKYGVWLLNPNGMSVAVL